ncbi:MAG: UDP-N-acetylenolpyruvoylglucosamine reductase, partial [Acidimicrobiia bacterium]|nr:UDP-N-acetylenolpyruvoylglucosamine reductase [Acidimicrobiia bacterium]
TARVISLETGKATSRNPADLGLSYRHSDLSATEVVVSATFRSVERSREDCEALLREITRWRRDHQPGGTFNAGSVFKNPAGGFAGQIIDELGLKGHRAGGASVSERHANFFVAEAGTTAGDIHRLVSEVQARVLAATGIRLEPEMRFVGDFEASA